MKLNAIRPLAAIILLTLVGCAGVVRNPLPAEEHLDATVLGRHDFRYWGDTTNTDDNTYGITGMSPEEVRTRYAGIMGLEHNYLAISGGGATGAFGAGALVGWTALGTRPEFTIVTGISTGALSAPFAFLGSEYDSQLKEIYTTLNTSNVFNFRNIFSVIGNDGLVDTSPLSKSLKKYVNDEVIAAIAAEYRRGRMLLIGTTNLDASRPVIWNIGRIANSGLPEAPDLIRDIIRASASVPGVFPPVYLRVQGHSGNYYDEMHVDGGTATQMFLYPSGIDWDTVTETLEVPGTPRAYLIRNSRIKAEYEPVDPRLAKIAARTIDSLIRTQGVGDAYRIYAIAERDGVDVHLTWVKDDSVEDSSEEAFDPEYMSKLFEYGYQRAINNQLWLELELD